MSPSPRVVAELGRPETPDETASRKAESSRVYRSSQTFRNLIAALIVTVAVVAVIVLAVPRGEPAGRPPIDVAETAATVSSSLGRTAIVPVVPATWSVNGAAVEGDATRAWTIVYVPDADEGFLRIAQGFDADAAWPTRVLKGAAATDTVTIDGIVWDRYKISDPAAAGNISTALSTQAGPDVVLVYGSADDDAVTTAASSVTADIRTLREETR